jgi:ubiquinone/menaquinone biosynthesis C-methylase UbiE
MATVTDSYILGGGTAGFDRMKVLSRVLHPATCALFERAGVGPELHCLDVGCGTGDTSFELARRVGARGRVLGIDLDPVKLDLARRDAGVLGLPHIEFRLADANELTDARKFDVIYLRLLLTHLPAPDKTLKNLTALLRPGGVTIAEDIDFTGYFCHPANAAHDRYCELYTRTTQSKGVDPNIGPRLPGLLMGAGLSRVQMNLVQQVNLVGETKRIPALTMSIIADAVVAGGHASRDEVERIVTELAELAERTDTIMGMPRMFQAWGRL